MTHQEKIIYLAGIVDGEGHFYKPLTKNGRGEGHFYARIVVVQKEPELIEWLKKEFMGSISFQDNETGGCYRWVIQGTKAEGIAKELAPYLIVKREQVKRIMGDTKPTQQNDLQANQVAQEPQDTTTLPSEPVIQE